jgi:peptide/nickel transport system substrate-binding protein
MLTRRGLLASSTAVLAAPLVIPGPGGRAEAATPKNVVVMAKQIDDIVGGYDPAESYEFTNNEGCGNIYRKLVQPNAAGTGLDGDLAEKWDVSKDGLTFTFHLRKDAKFESGSPVTAEDAAFSLQRVVKLNKTPGFIITQFGFTADNVEKLITAKDAHTLELKLPAIAATSFVLFCLSSTCGSVVEKAVVMKNQAGSDMGNAWLKMHSTATGPYRLIDWQASDHVIYGENPHTLVKPHVPRIVVRHTADPSAQLLLLQKGDADIARDLTADQLKVVTADKNLHNISESTLTSFYMAMNMGQPEFKKNEVLQAVKYAVDYEAIAKNITPGTATVWQSFLPKGVPGAISDQPFKKDVAKAKELMAKAGYPNGFSCTMDHFAQSPYTEIAQAIQADLAEIGIKLQLLAAEKKQVYTKMRARQHQMILLTWFPDYLDANSNAQAYCANPDDSDNSKLKILAWRCHFFDPELTKMVEDASKELDTPKRMAMYADMQRKFMQRSPFVMILQSVDNAPMRKNVNGLKIGALADYTRYAGITKA